MQQQLSAITLGVRSIEPSKRFYMNGFGWVPVLDNGEVVFYQMNGFVLGTWTTSELEEDMQRTGLAAPGAFSLAHNVGSPGEVDGLIERLAAAGGRSFAGVTLLRMAVTVATLQILTGTPGKSPGTQRGPLTATDMCFSEANADVSQVARPPDADEIGKRQNPPAIRYLPPPSGSKA